MDNIDLGSVENEDFEIGFDPFVNADDTAEISQQEEQPTTLTTTTGETKEVVKSDLSELAEKPPVFEYAGASETIDDASKTFEEIRLEKAADFPELEDGKRISWTVEYGKITKTVADPKGTSIGKIKSDIETSKEFEDSLKKRGADKKPSCKVKPRVTAQSKGTVAYKGVFATLEDAESAGKVISIVPAKDGKVYEIRNTEMGTFTTPVSNCPVLSDVKAGFVPALPLIPMDLMMRVVAFFRLYMTENEEKEVLVNVYWDKQGKQFIADVPEQFVTSGSVHSKLNETFENERYIHYMDIHSHNSMKAFFSSVDDYDEKATRLYTVIGDLHEYFPVVKTRISNGGNFFEIDPAEVFELVAKPFPEEWKDNIYFKEKEKDGDN